MFNPADDAVWERLEEALLLSDCGVPGDGGGDRAARGRGRRRPADNRRGARTRLQEIIAELMTPAADARIDITAHPAVLLVSGVNGTGKTTSIGKIAWHLREAGRTCVIGAADTFRAAAGEQLETWAKRAEADFVSSQSGADPAAVAFDAVSAAESRGRDVVIVDTAGRLHTQGHLMDELRKIHRVIAQRIPGAPHEVLLTIDATCGASCWATHIFAAAICGCPSACTSAGTGPCPLLGANLSGFTMNVTGYAMHWKIGDLLSGGAYGPEGGLLTTAVAIGLFFYLARPRSSIRKRSSGGR